MITHRTQTDDDVLFNVTDHGSPEGLESVLFTLPAESVAVNDHWKEGVLATISVTPTIFNMLIALAQSHVESREVPE